MTARGRFWVFGDTPSSSTDDITPGPELSAEDYLDAGLGDQDRDSDGFTNSTDVCPLLADPEQLDTDSDTYGDLCDCLPADSSAWAKPSETPRLTIANLNALTWSEPEFPGGDRPAYDTLRSSDPSDFMTAVICVEANDGTDRQTIDASRPEPGRAYFYLVRAETNCPAGLGTLGVSSSGLERTGIDCAVPSVQGD